MSDYTPKIVELDMGWKAIQNRINQAAKKSVKVGFIKDSEELRKAAIHEYGGTIDHPGGTSYGYKTKRDMKNRRVKFLRKGKGVFEMGVTGPHKIEIPARPFIRPTFDKKQKEMREFTRGELNKVIYDDLDPKIAMYRIGSKFQVELKNTISNGEAEGPELKRATIKRKGSSTKLLDTGKMQGSIKVQVITEKAKK